MWFLDKNFMLNLKIYLLQTTGGELWVKSAFLCAFGTFLYVSLHKESLFQIMRNVVSN